jgi:hypothetical protein
MFKSPLDDQGPRHTFTLWGKSFGALLLMQRPHTETFSPFRAFIPQLNKCLARKTPSPSFKHLCLCPTYVKISKHEQFSIFCHTLDEFHFKTLQFQCTASDFYRHKSAILNLAMVAPPSRVRIWLAPIIPAEA